MTKGMKDFKENVIACSDCDLLMNRPPLERGYVLSCPRCGKKLAKSVKNSVSKTFALALAALILFIPAIFLPLVNLETLGLHSTGNVVESIVVFYKSGYYFVAFIFGFFSLLFPLLLIGSVLLVSGSLYFDCYPGWLKKIFRFYIHIEEWTMLEVYLLGIIISIIKIKGMGSISYETGFFCFTLLVVLTVFMRSVLDEAFFWSLLEYQGKIPERKDTERRLEQYVTAASVGLILCQDCQKLIPEDAGYSHCSRCGSKLFLRKRLSFSRTWALLICSFFFLIPANVLPIMNVDFLGSLSASTIMDGIIYFFQDGSYFIGAIILIASVLVPLFKVVGIAILLVSTYLRSARGLRKKTIMFRVIAFVGRWSMLDIFVIGLLAAFVDFGFFTSIGIDTAVTYFAAVVVLTMCAVIVYDPRIMWDSCQPVAFNEVCLGNIKKSK